MPVWVDAFEVGALVAHPVYGETRYTADRLTNAITNFRKLRAQGYTTTVLREHGREDSYVYGEVHDLRMSGGYFQAYIEFYRQEERQAYNDGILREFSPGFAPEWLDPHTNEVLTDVFIEISFTSRAYQRNLRAPQDINPGVQLNDLGPLHVVYSGHLLTTSNEGGTMADDIQPVEEPQADEAVESTEETEVAPEFNLREEFEGLKAVVAGLAELLKPAEPEVALSDDQTRIQNLEAEVATLKADKTRLELSAKGIPADRVEGLVALSAKLDANEFAQVVEYSRPTTVQAEIGSTGVAQTGAEDVTAAEIVELAAKDGASYGNGLTVWLANNHPERVDEVLEVARH